MIFPSRKCFSLWIIHIFENVRNSHQNGDNRSQGEEHEKKKKKRLPVLQLLPLATLSLLIHLSLNQLMKQLKYLQSLNQEIKNQLNLRQLRLILGKERRHIPKLIMIIRQVINHKQVNFPPLTLLLIHYLMILMVQIKCSLAQK